MSGRPVRLPCASVVPRRTFPWSAARRCHIIEHVFERPVTLRPDRESVVERELARLLDGVAAGVVGYPVDLVTPEGRVVRAGGPPLPVEVDDAVARHGRPSSAGSEGEASAAGGPSSDEALAGRAARVDARVAAGAVPLRAARAAQASLARAAAERARAVAAFARCRPASLDRPDGAAGAAAAATRAGRPAVLTPVSEWAVDEVAVALALTGEAASKLLVDSLLLEERLPGTLAALGEGLISWEHARVMTEVVASLPDAVRGSAEARLLGRVAGKTPAQLRAAARRVVARLDAAAVAERMAQAIRDRRVSVYPGEDGMATLSAVLPAPVAGGAVGVGAVRRRGGHRGRSADPGAADGGLSGRPGAAARGTRVGPGAGEADGGRGRADAAGWGRAR